MRKVALTLEFDIDEVTPQSLHAFEAFLNTRGPGEELTKRLQTLYGAVKTLKTDEGITMEAINLDHPVQRR